MTRRDRAAAKGNTRNTEITAITHKLRGPVKLHYLLQLKAHHPTKPRSKPSLSPRSRNRSFQLKTQNHNPTSKSTVRSVDNFSIAFSLSNMQSIFIVGAKRTPFGAFGGALKHISATGLAVHATKAALAASNVDPTWVDCVYIGNVIQSSADAAYLARHVALVCMRNAYY